MSKCVCDAVGGLVLEYCYVREAACIAAACGSWSECMEAYKEAIERRYVRKYVLHNNELKQNTRNMQTLFFVLKNKT